MSPEYEAPVFKRALRDIHAAFAAGMGVDSEFDYNMGSGLVKATKQHDPDYVQGLNGVMMEFQSSYTSWLLQNYQLRKDDAFQFRAAQEEWLKTNTPLFIEQATTDGKYYSVESYRERTDQGIPQ